MNSTEFPFSYGTLQSDSAQLTIFGRRLEGTEDRLIGYMLKWTSGSYEKRPEGRKVVVACARWASAAASFASVPTRLIGAIHQSIERAPAHPLVLVDGPIVTLLAGVCVEFKAARVL